MGPGVTSKGGITSDVCWIPKNMFLTPSEVQQLARPWKSRGFQDAKKDVEVEDSLWKSMGFQDEWHPCGWTWAFFFRSVNKSLAVKRGCIKCGAVGLNHWSWSTKKMQFNVEFIIYPVIFGERLYRYSMYFPSLKEERLRTPETSKV